MSPPTHDGAASVRSGANHSAILTRMPKTLKRYLRIWMPFSMAHSAWHT